MQEKNRYTSKNIDSNKKISEALEELAYELSTNYATTSFGDKEKEDVNLGCIFHDDSLCIEKLDPERKGNAKVMAIQRHRNILVIGAGASHDSYKCIPLGRTTVEELKKKYMNRIEQFDAIRNKFEKKKYDMLKENGLSDLDFENYMSLFSDIILTPQEVRSFLKEYTNFNESPSLFYEVAAHMFKHSFIDVIINFNFDELLDHAIEEELGAGNYKYILNDGDCFDINKALVDGRLKVPIYIKPHGTISQKSSLRFTKAHYLEMSDEMKEFISTLVKGYRGPDKEPIEKVNLISVGFNMESVEFKDILEKHLPHESRIFHFMYDSKNTEDAEVDYVARKLPEFFDRVKTAFFKKKPKSFSDLRKIAAGDLQTIHHQKHKKDKGVRLSEEVYKRIDISGFNKQKPEDNNLLTSPFSELFCLLWRITANQFKKSYEPRSISRHEIISYLFYDAGFIFHPAAEADEYNRDKLREKYEDRVTYYRDRVIIEIAIAINRNKGILDAVELANDRAGMYYQKYQSCYERSVGKKRGTRLYTFNEMIAFFIEEESAKAMLYDRNIFTLQTHSREILKEKLRNFQISKNYLAAKKLDDTGSIQIDGQLINKLEKIFEDKHLLAASNNITPTIIYHVLRCPIMSSQFISSLKSNYDKKCYNGRMRMGYRKTGEPLTMLEELCRLLNKSIRNHYYQIKPKYDDRKNLVIESLSKRKILHTNLSLEFEIRRLLGAGEWDRLLSIAEVGSYFHYLRHLGRPARKNGQKSYTPSGEEVEYPLHGNFDPADKKLIMIHSLDAIGNVQHAGDPIRNVSNIRTHELFDNLKTYYKNSKGLRVDAHSTPFWQHNHHMIIFLKKVDKNSGQLKTEYPFFDLCHDGRGFIMLGSFYMYRHGFSNHISPAYIGSDLYEKDYKYINNDFHRLLSIFFMNYQRAIAFEKTSNPLDLEFNIDTYRNWMNNKHFEEKLREFMDVVVWDRNITKTTGVKKATRKGKKTTK